MPDSAAFHANLQRGILLQDQDRFQEAIPLFQAAIAANPEAPQAYAHLAQCWNEFPAHQVKALDAIDRAISLEPENSLYFGLKAWIQLCQSKNVSATHTARQGLTLDPTCPQCLNALANAFTHLREWKNAEITCRRILEFNPDNSAGLNLLAQTLRHQGRTKESREIVDHLLSLYPNNAFGLANAGHAALAVGDHLRANDHFREALRLDPHSDFARLGLLTSLRDRIWLNRLNRRLLYWISARNAPEMRRPLGAFETIRMILGAGLLLTICLYGSRYLYDHHPFALWLGWYLFGGLILLYAVLAFVVYVIGDSLLLFDPIGRHSLTHDEKIQAYICGGAFLFITALVFSAQGGFKLGLVMVPLFLLSIFSIQLPLLKDRWLRRREPKA